jgi:hypothetical protein
VSIDVADGGLDESVVTVVRHFQSFRRVEKVKRYSFDKSVVHRELAAVALQLFVAWGGVQGQDDFVVDCSGPGGGTAGELLHAQHAVVQYMGGSGSSNSAKWKNRRAQSYMNLRDEYRDDLIDFAAGCFDSENDSDEYQNQLCTIEKKPGTERLEELVPKEEMKRNGMKSPDMSDSHAMQYATQTPTLISRAHVQVAQDIVISHSSVLEGYAG